MITENDLSKALWELTLNVISKKEKLKSRFMSLVKIILSKPYVTATTAHAQGFVF